MRLQQNLLRVLGERGWSQTRLAMASNVPKSTIHGWLTGRGVLDLDQLRAVANVLKISFYWLLFGQDDPHHRTDNTDPVEIFDGDVSITIRRLRERLDSSGSKH